MERLTLTMSVPSKLIYRCNLIATSLQKYFILNKTLKRHMENCRTKNGEDNFEEETSRHTFKTYFVAKVIKTVLN